MALGAIGGVAGDAAISAEDGLAGSDAGGFDFEIAFESLVFGDDFASDGFDRNLAATGDDSGEGKCVIVNWGNDLGIFLIAEPVPEGWDTYVREFVSEEFWLRALFGLGEVEEISDEAGAVVEGAAAAFLFIAPIRIEVEEAALPGVEDAAFHGVENVGKGRAVIYGDGGGNDFHHLVFAGDIVAGAGIILG